MWKRKVILSFLVRFTLLFLLLAFPWPGVNQAYQAFLCTFARAIFLGSGPRQLTFELHEQSAETPEDIRVVIVNQALLNADGSGPVRNLDVGFGWQPVALLLALILSTPIPWKRRGWALLWELLSLHCLLFLCLKFFIWDESSEILLTTISPFWKQVAGGLRHAIGGQLRLTVPVLIWILVTFRRDRLTRGFDLPSVEPDHATR